MRIIDIIAREIFDSRSEPTLEVEVKTLRGAFRASVPAGKSAGSREAAVFKFPAAKRSIALISRRVRSQRFASVSAFDSFLVRLDGTERKTRLGGNALLALSMAFARGIAHEKKKELWQVIQQEFFSKSPLTKPLIFANLVNGGLHAPETGLDLQEYIAVMAGKERMALRVEKLIQLYRAVGAALKKQLRGKGDLALGDEAGYAVKFKDNFEPILILDKVIRDLGFSKFCRIGIDAAASSFARGNFYHFGGRKIKREALALQYQKWAREAPLFFSLEDPFSENDHEGFRILRQALDKHWVIGDDLTVTSSGLIRRAARNGLLNGVIIKPNQIGTVAETCRAIQAARDHKLKIIVSHRSGETEDNFIIHLARASGADGVKIGSPARERITKFNELIRLYDTIKL